MPFMAKNLEASATMHEHCRICLYQAIGDYLSELKLKLTRLMPMAGR